MDLVRLDSYEYELTDLYDDNDEYMHTVLRMDFESTVDSAMHDILNELSTCSTVHVNGRYFTCKKRVLEDNVAYNNTTLYLLMIEETYGKEGMA